MRVSFCPEALGEAEDAARRYRANGGANPAHKFAQELRRVVNLAAVQPGIASPEVFAEVARGELAMTFPGNLELALS